MAASNEIAGYEIMGTLGYGARSTIFAARDSENHLFALKRVLKNNAADQRFLDQAVLEHEVARKFSHPSLRKSFKLMRQRKLMRTTEVVVVMEFVDGLSLEQARPRSLRRLVRIFQDTAIGLGVMHRGGYVHADIKPNNILITEKDIVKVIDFGQSCPIGTVKERIQGTPDYIAPEQVKRQEITPRTDVFNLGATMYWCLTRKHVPTMIPRPGESVSKKIKLMKPPPSPRDLNPDIPPALSSLVMSCIEADPLERPQSMTQIYERLEISIGQFFNDLRSGGKGQTQRSRSLCHRQLRSADRVVHL